MFQRGAFFIFLGAAVFIFTSAAHAEQRRLTEWAELPASKQSSLELYRASVHRLDSQDGRCTLTTVSRTGQMLTARHCLQICLIQSGVFERRSEQGVDYFVTSPSHLETATCQVRIDGESRTIIVEATSPGWIASSDELTFRAINPGLYQRLVHQGYTDRGDFALIRVLGTTDTSCVPLAFNSVRAGEPVYSLGYPSVTHRRDGFNSNGVSLYFTSGTITSGIAQNECVAGLSKERLRELVSTYDQPGSFMNTLDGFYGSSGSSVLNASGEVIGVLTNIYLPPPEREQDQPDERYCRGSMKALALKDLRPFLHDVDVSCPVGNPAAVASSQVAELMN